MYHEIIDFWFQELEQKQWFFKDQKLDDEIKNRFGDLHQKAVQCELFEWRANPLGRLAEIIILDQFSRNIYREKPESFASDPMALTLAQECIRIEDDQKLSTEKRVFIYMPFMHSESLVIHDQAIQLFEDLGNPNNLKFEHAHRDIIKRFGRYPHRNQILSRQSTAEELKFLKKPGSSF